MKLKKKALLYDIANLAFTIADTVKDQPHAVHQVRDICEEGNIDRVARVLGLAYSNILAVLMPVIKSPWFCESRDFSSSPHDYELCFRNEKTFPFPILPETKRLIKETSHEYMVCMVLADWLAITLPECAEVWKLRASAALNMLKQTVLSVMSGGITNFRRKISPF